MSEAVSCDELKQQLEKGAVVVDVMTPEDYESCHVAGAENACIYEMVFLDRIAECVPAPESELIIYDATGTTRTAELARDRLYQAGYRKVSILSGGLSAWIEAGLPVERGERALCEFSLADGGYSIDTENSRLEWIGRNLNNRHFGRINIKGGELLISGGKLSAGSIVLDMDTIENLDLNDPLWRDMLIKHLKSEDFFAVERFPTATFTLAGWDPQEGASPEASSGIAYGDLSIRDVARRVSFPAVVAPQPDGSIKAHAAFDIDRTLWNVSYGSCRLFERLGMHLVHDMVGLELFVVALRA